MKKIFLLLVLGFVLLLPASAHAFIIDTGEGVNEIFGVSIYNRSNGDFQINAGQFVLNQSYNITSLETWMYSTNPGSVDLVLYGDNNNLPNAADEILRQSFNVASPGPIIDWQGLTNLNLQLDSGSYWISLEKPDVLDGFSVNLPTGAPNPLNYYAYRAEQDNNGDWVNYSGHQGFRVGGNPAVSSVPEPATIGLFAVGLGLILRRRIF